MRQAGGHHTAILARQPLAGRAGERVLKIADRLAVDNACNRLHPARRVVRKSRDKPGIGAQRIGHVARQLLEESSTGNRGNACRHFQHGGLNAAPFFLCPQADDTECHILRQLLQQLELVFSNRAHIHRIQRQKTECLLLMLERQRHHAVIAIFLRLFMQRVMLVLHHILDDDRRTGTYRTRAGAGAAGVFRSPAQIELGKEILRAAFMRLQHNGAGRIMLGISDPGHEVTANLHRQLANIVQQLLFVARTYQRLVAQAQHAQGTVQALQFQRGLFLFGNILQGAFDTDGAARFIADGITDHMCIQGVTLDCMQLKIDRIRGSGFDAVS